MKKLEDMKDFSGYSIDELLDRRDDLEGMLFGFEDEDEIIIMDLLGKINKELKKKGWIDKEEEKERGMIDSLREDKTEEKGNFGFGRDYEDDGYGDLPF